MIVIQSKFGDTLIEVKEIALYENTISCDRKLTAGYSTVERAKEVFEDIRQAISRGDRTFELPME